MAGETPAASPAPVTQESSQTDDSNSTTTDAQTTSVEGAVKVAAKKEAERKFKIKYGKTEREVAEKDLIAMAQKGWASDERFQSAAQKERQMQAIFQKWKEDPDAVMRALGEEDPVEFHKARLSAELKRRILTPEQRELEDLRAKLKKSEEDDKTRSQKESEAKLEHLTNHYAQQYDKEMSAAIAESGLPKTAKTVKRAAELAYKNLKMGLDLPWSTILDMVREEYTSDIKELFGASQADKLMGLFGEDVVKKLTSASLKSRVTDPESVTDENRSGSKQKREKAQPKIIGEDEWEERMKRFKGG